MKPRRNTPINTHTTPEVTAIMLAMTTARMASPPDRGSTTARITGARDESGPEHKNATGTKDRVREQGHYRGIKSVDSGNARSQRISDADWHQHSSQHQTGHHIVRRPCRFVLSQDLESR